MSKFGKWIHKKWIRRIGKFGFITTLGVELLGLLFSTLINTALKDTSLNSIIYYSYGFRFELVALLIVTIFIFCVFVIYKMTAVYQKRTRLFVLLVLVWIVSISLPEIIPFIKTRYYYYNSKIYNVDIQSLPLNKAKDLYEQKDWDDCLKALNEAKSITGNNAYYYSNNIEIEKGIRLVTKYIDYSEILWNSYLESDDTILTKRDYFYIRTISNLYPNKYRSIYLSMYDSINNAINDVPLLYKSVEKEDICQCKELIQKYGWCWFEPTVYCMFVKENDDELLIKLSHYINEFSILEMKQRLLSVWEIDKYYY